MEWAIEECAKTSLPVGASMCIGPEGDMHGVSAAECAIRMARAGAKIGNVISISISISINVVDCVFTQTMSVQQSVPDIDSIPTFGFFPFCQNTN